MSSTLLLLALAANSPAQVVAPAAPGPNAAIRWNRAALRAIRTERTPPPLAARNLAILHVAMYDAVNAVRPTHRFFRFPTTVRGPVSAECAASIAAHRVLAELYPNRMDEFDHALDECMELVPDEDARAQSIRLGQSVAERALAWRQWDGATRRIDHPGSLTPGLWRPTPPGYRPALLPQWRYVTPFAVARVTDFLPPPPPRLDSPEFTRALQEVQLLGARDGSTRTREQTIIALFWDDGEGTVTPVGHWNRIGEVLALQRNLHLPDAARMFALLNVCLADAGVLCWETKFRYDLVRPITVLQDAQGDIDPALRWWSLLNTPPFPSYTSGHSTFSGAAATALAAFFGTDALPFRVGSDGLPGFIRAYPGIWAAAQEAGRSRIYGGIHYEFDNAEGLACGRNIAAAIARTAFLPLAPGEPPTVSFAVRTRPAR